MRGKHVFIQVNRRRFFQDETSSIPPEIERLENSVEAVLFSGKDKTKQLSEFRNASYAVANQANLDTDRHFLIEAIFGMERIALYSLVYIAIGTGMAALAPRYRARQAVTG